MEAKMFKVGDLVLYGTTGVCRVSEIKEKDLTGKGKTQLYYHLAPLYQTCVISAPVNSDKIFIRPIISREEAERLIDHMSSISSDHYPTGAARELTEQYEAAINTHDCIIWASLLHSIYTKKEKLTIQKKKFSSLDERYMRKTEDLLFGELAAAMGMDRKAVASVISKRISEAM